MAKTILITGASTGIGRATAHYFAQQKWNVAATMRQPEQHQDLLQHPNVKTYALDVTDPDSIHHAIEQAISDFGTIDVVLNNAGYGALGIFEATTPEQMHRQFDTNVFGTMRVIQQILPHFRNNKNGTIINVSSVAGRITFPAFSLYHGSKWAVEGFSESLHYELRHLGIKVRIIEPGAIKTDFYSRSMDFLIDDILTEYEKYARAVRTMMERAGGAGVAPDVVARTIYKAANDRSHKLRYPVGFPAPVLIPLRKLLPESWFFRIVRAAMEIGLK